MEPTQTAEPDQSIEIRPTDRRLATVLLLCAAGLLIVICMVRAAVSWRHDANIDHVSGVWFTMSQDLLDGVFYRPISGPLGYGGTRYMPLFFVMHAGLWKALGSWRIAGHAIAAASVVALVVGVYVFLRRLEVSRAFAFGAAGVFLAGVGGKYALLDMRADGLAAALSLWGVVVSASGFAVDVRDDAITRTGVGPAKHASRNTTLAAVLFTLAFAAKVTTVFGVAAVVLWLWFNAQRRLAVWLAGGTAMRYLAVIALTDHFSSGRFLQILRATAAGGGSKSFAFSAPLRIADELTMSAPDAVLLVLACAVLLAAGRRVWRTLPAILFITTLAVTLVIFGSPGTVGNHLVDLEVACAVVIVANIASKPLWRDLARYALAGTMVLATLHYWQEFEDTDTDNMHASYTEIEDAVRATGKPVLTEQPLIAIEAGQRPYVLDPFMFRVFAARDPRIAQPLWDKLDAKAFGAVVLEYDPRTGEGTYVYDSVHFGPPFRQHLTANYEFVKQVGDLFVWKPKGAAFPTMEDQ
jgi:hypothetical protein